MRRILKTDLSTFESNTLPRPVSISISHQLGKAEARRRIAGGFGKLKTQLSGGGMAGAMLSINERWEENDRLVFEGGALGQRLRGHLDVLDDAVIIELYLPNLLAALAEKIAGNVKKEGQRLLTKR